MSEQEVKTLVGSSTNIILLRVTDKKIDNFFKIVEKAKIDIPPPLLTYFEQFTNLLLEYCLNIDSENSICLTFLSDDFNIKYIDSLRRLFAFWLFALNLIDYNYLKVIFDVILNRTFPFGDHFIKFVKYCDERLKGSIPENKKLKEKVLLDEQNM